MSPPTAAPPLSRVPPASSRCQRSPAASVRSGCVKTFLTSHFNAPLIQAQIIQTFPPPVHVVVASFFLSLCLACPSHHLTKHKQRSKQLSSTLDARRSIAPSSSSTLDPALNAAPRLELGVESKRPPAKPPLPPLYHTSCFTSAAADHHLTRQSTTLFLKSKLFPTSSPPSTNPLRRQSQVVRTDLFINPIKQPIPSPSLLHLTWLLLGSSLSRFVPGIRVSTPASATSTASASASAVPVPLPLSVPASLAQSLGSKEAAQLIRSTAGAQTAR